MFISCPLLLPLPIPLFPWDCPIGFLLGCVLVERSWWTGFGVHISGSIAQLSSASVLLPWACSVSTLLCVALTYVCAHCVQGCPLPIIHPHSANCSDLYVESCAKLGVRQAPQLPSWFCLCDSFSVLRAVPWTLLLWLPHLLSLLPPSLCCAWPCGFPVPGVSLASL